MGMFQQKPEEPGEWAGLPSEPFTREEPTDLPEPTSADALGVQPGAGVTSLSIDLGALAAGTPPEAAED